MKCIQSCSSGCNAGLEGWRRDDWGIGAEKSSHLQGGTTNGFLVLLVLEEPELISSPTIFGLTCTAGFTCAGGSSFTFIIQRFSVGSTIGAVVCILVGTLAREHSGPALAFSFLIAGIAAALSAFCYAELASRCPSAGSVYHYSYICVGEGLAWIIGWALILEYTIGGSAVARGISPNLALLFGGPDSLPPFLARYTVLALGMAGLQSYERSRYFLFMDHISLFNKINYFYKDGYDIWLIAFPIVERNHQLNTRTHYTLVFMFGAEPT
ncbi:putative amino acid/polyamine transporter I [Helianthus annuus]|uniref:Amino acid/polyamine transporter I n=1 Tax=Helianthus annuus TaxID=4232 RepID=A0A251T9D8_HELAN|nr:putative amino acid/polyamine transporter I [Helianthus annuus]KAJ0570078.1 putative amino acid/polyamine transporter I [Helianthus annuus]KAJ0576806.1 putative amino acid/polyamine transporter I [Helianthus annuus]KAJ0584408.1 putative amino acid/polyamine transporter I [Helianthus annuus]KAJ0747035.1 putative amino acid/polyamine transporter I [Helianthus annuus]